MLAYIKANYKAGDAMELTTSEGVFTGQIEFISDSYIILRQADGQVCGIADSDIRSFRATLPAAPVAPIEPTAVGTADATAPAAEKTEARPAAPQETPDAPKLTGVPAVGEPKVVGHIDLDRLKQIDPKFSRRSYFRPTESESTATEATAPRQRRQPMSQTGLRERTESRYIDPNNKGGDSPREHKPYVSARGRITYYNPEKHFGFIHDYNDDVDLYFNQQQIADPDLYNRPERGIKVAYTISSNRQGPAAFCVHLPRTVDDLLDIAADLYEGHHYNLSRGLVEHALAVDPDNKVAADLAAQLSAQEAEAPYTARPVRAGNLAAELKLPTTHYAEAKKAFLAKQYAEAERLYKEAIDKGEKVESCVKDLVTLYVSRFKQAEDPAEKEAARQQAINFLDSHRQDLPDNLTTRQFIALNYYLPIQDYESFLKEVDDILADPKVSDSVSRRAFYIWQKAIAHNKLGHKDEALRLIEEGLAISPLNRQLSSLKEMILHPECFADFSEPAKEGGETSQAPAEEKAEPEKTAE